MWWLTKLRKEGIINPIKPSGYWLYSEEQVRQIPALITEARKCERCGKPRPLGRHRLCRECSQYRKNQRVLAWKKANPEKLKEIRSRAHKKERAKRFERTG